MAKFASIMYTATGIAGMSAVAYDALAKAKRQSSVGAEQIQTDVFESSVSVFISFAQVIAD